MKTNVNVVPGVKTYIDGLKIHIPCFEDVIVENIGEDIGNVKEYIPPLKQQMTELKVEVKKTHVKPADLNTQLKTVRNLLINNRYEYIWR